MIPSAPFDQTQPATAYAEDGEGDRVADRASTYAYDTNGRLSAIHPTDRAPLRFDDGRPTPPTRTNPHGHRRLNAEPGSSDDDHSAASIPETARPGIYTYDASPRTCAPPRCAATDPLPFTAQNARALAPRHDYGATTISLWLSRDPIGEAGGINVCGMVENDPVNRIDPVGLLPTTLETTPDGILLIEYWASPGGALTIGGTALLAQPLLGVKEVQTPSPNPGRDPHPQPGPRPAPLNSFRSEVRH